VGVWWKPLSSNSDSDASSLGHKTQDERLTPLFQSMGL
jgi:hypothetical protein